MDKPSCARRSFALVVAVIPACNQVFDIRETGQQDAAPKEYFDAPTDAPFECPGLEETPHFSRLVNQIEHDIREISVSSPPVALLGLCTQSSDWCLGPADGSTAPIELIVSGTALDGLKLVPEGNAVYARDKIAATARLVEITRDPSTNTWSESLDIIVPGGVTPFIQFGIPSRGPVRRVMVLNGTASIRELEVPATGQAIEVASYSFAELGVNSMYQVPNLSEDGLRIIYVGEDGQGIQRGTYNVRASLADRFTRAASLPELPRVFDLYMNPDCSRMYFSGLNSVFWVMRQ